MDLRQAFHRIKETLVCVDYLDGRPVSSDSILDEEQDMVEEAVIRAIGASPKVVPAVEYGYGDGDCYVCGNCGCFIEDEIDWDYCPLCGYRVRKEGK